MQKARQLEVRKEVWSNGGFPTTVKAVSEG